MPLVFVSRYAPHLYRHASTSSSTSSLKLVAELRKRTTVTIQKAREALIASDGDMSGALEWLERDRASTGQRKAEKVGGRFAGEGLIGISVLSRGTCRMSALGVRAAMVELNCETDFVGRNELFRKLTQDLAFTAAYMAEPPLSSANEPQPFIRPIDLTHLQNAPLMHRDSEDRPISVSEAIHDLINAVGENINIRRAASFVHNPISPATGVGLRVASYTHGALAAPRGDVSVTTETQGMIAALAAVGLKTSPRSRLGEILQSPTFEEDLGALERGLARQIVGLRPETVRGDGDTALYNQTFDTLATSGGQDVQNVLRVWSAKQRMIDNADQDDIGGLSVIEFSRWEVGEGL